jgi:hypothetical protein
LRRLPTLPPETRDKRDHLRNAPVTRLELPAACSFIQSKRHGEKDFEKIQSRGAARTLRVEQRSDGPVPVELAYAIIERAAADEFDVAVRALVPIRRPPAAAWLRDLGIS